MTDVMEKLFTASDASLRTGGFFVSAGNTDPDILSVSIDSRTVKPGDLFIALKGEFTDGHNYIFHADKAGASAVMISEKYYLDNIKNNSCFRIDCSLIIVKDTLLGFQNLAASWVSDFDKLIKIAVTGSNGKSTTKEMIGSILAEEGSTIINEVNLNSETGLPLSVLKIESHHEFGVFEMGISHPGEMKDLVAILNPDYALITNIGTAHIGLLGSKEAIAFEKSNVFSLFDKNNTGFINEDDPWASYLEDRCPGNIIVYGHISTEGIEKATDLGLKGWEIQYKDQKIDLKLVGRHNLTNAIASISLAAALGVSPLKIKRGLEKINALRGRSRIIEGRYTVIEDSYNANADSMARIFNFISDLNWSGRLVLVLGSMKELGSFSEEMHELVGRQALALNPDLLFFYGEEMEKPYNAALNAQYSGKLIYTEDYSELERNVLDVLEKGDLVLMKGSLTMNLNKLADTIVKLMEVVDV